MGWMSVTSNCGANVRISSRTAVAKLSRIAGRAESPPSDVAVIQVAIGDIELFPPRRGEGDIALMRHNADDFGPFGSALRRRKRIRFPTADSKGKSLGGERLIHNQACCDQACCPPRRKCGRRSGAYACASK